MSGEVAWGSHMIWGFLVEFSKERPSLQVGAETCLQLGPRPNFEALESILRAFPVLKTVTIKGRTFNTVDPLKRMPSTLKYLYSQQPLERKSKFPVLRVLMSVVYESSVILGSSVLWSLGPKCFLSPLACLLLPSYQSPGY